MYKLTKELQQDLADHKVAHAQLSQHLREIDRRQLWREDGFNSLEEFAQFEYGFHPEDLNIILFGKSEDRLLSEVARYDKLIEKIEAVYCGNRSTHSSFGDEEFSDPTLEMFQVVKTGTTSATLILLSNEEVFEHVHFPQEILPLLRQGDTFLMTLRRRGECWQVIEMSPPYL